MTIESREDEEKNDANERQEDVQFTDIGATFSLNNSIQLTNKRISKRTNIFITQSRNELPSKCHIGKLYNKILEKKETAEMNNDISLIKDGVCVC